MAHYLLRTTLLYIAQLHHAHALAAPLAETVGSVLLSATDLSLSYDGRREHAAALPRNAPPSTRTLKPDFSARLTMLETY